MPAHVQFSLEESLSAGKFAASTVGDPGAQGAGVTGTQGIGVNTPNAAAVAAITAGLLGELHIPKGGIFAAGLLSMILAIGMDVVILLTGGTCKAPGAAPKLHCSIAPPHTLYPI
jgi:hypothetical protein